MPLSNLWDHLSTRCGEMRNVRSPYISHYRDLSEFIQPYRGRFTLDDVDRGGKRFQNIINSRGTRAHRIARSGLFAGLMSPNRPWLKLETLSDDLTLFPPVANWLYATEQAMLKLFLQTNLYNAAPVLLGETLLFATGAMGHLESASNVASFFAYPAGSYLIDQSEDQTVNAFVYEAKMTASRMIERYGRDRVSQQVRTAFDRSNYSTMFPVTVFVEPNPDFRLDALDSRFFRFRSTHFEPNGVRDRFLRQSGFREFPYYVPRWDRTGEDVYGTNCPAMEVLGDIRGMQIMEREKSKAVELNVRPPLGGPPELRTKNIDKQPGGVTFYESTPTNRLQPVYQVDPRIQEMRFDIQAIEQRINEGFFVDMFLAITSMPGIQPKNQLELLQRNAERLIQLGPALEQFFGEFLTPMVARTFNQMARANLLPPPPPELEDQQLQVRYISTLALAQRSFEVDALERHANYVGTLAGLDPQAQDKFNTDESIDLYGHLVGVHPSVIVPTEIANQVREQRAEQARAVAAAEQAQALAGAAQSGAGGVKQLVEADQIAQQEEGGV